MTSMCQHAQLLVNMESQEHNAQAGLEPQSS
jgi:hypothetical protein